MQKIFFTIFPPTLSTTKSLRRLGRGGRDRLWWFLPRRGREFFCGRERGGHGWRYTTVRFGGTSLLAHRWKESIRVKRGERRSGTVICHVFPRISLPEFEGKPFETGKMFTFPFFPLPPPPQPYSLFE